jgi:UDP-N-acetylmuramyl pentapeptide synthase
MGNKPYNNKDMESAVKDDNYTAALNSMQAAIAVIHYLNHPIINSHMASSLNEVHSELGLANNRWADLSNRREYAQEWWSI